ncbi:DMT family transporter [Microbacterium sp. No. 7]|uniref:DMT family transporter n=1 Tax=Microbacterium sp. No. 7 TaxID=1714373 RepID=UPI0006D1BD75|nr:SMR family transporter [Microbacterium sp. No. 7]ALJ21691.1 hypothetical protein AOA12_18050 [Microbacterium sp. No. 7]
MGMVFLAIAIVAEVAATTSLKLTTGENPAWWAWIVVVIGYIVAFASLQRCLDAGFPLGIAYAIWCGVGVTVVALLSFWLFREGLTAWQIAGIALVVVGIGCLELGRAPEPAAASSATVVAETPREESS